MDWYERRKNLFLGVTGPTQNLALIGATPSEVRSYLALSKVNQLLAVSLCRAAASCALVQQQP